MKKYDEVHEEIPEAPTEVLPRRSKTTWVDMTCPECDSPFIAEDRFGKYCCLCTWADDK